MRTVLIRILMLAACTLMLGGYGCQALTDPGVASTATPDPTPPLEPTANPSPTPSHRPSPTANPSPTPSHRPSPTTSDSAIPPIGEQAPDFTLPSVWGDMVTLSSYEGHKNIVLLFYRTGG